VSSYGVNDCSLSGVVVPQPLQSLT
jgi:hypothetical protein